MLRKTLFLLCVCCLPLSALHAEELPPQSATQAQPTLVQRYVLGARQVMSATKTGIENVFDKSFSFLGIKYRFGGDGPEDGGFDCSGLVRKVFGDALGLSLPRTAAEMAKLGDRINNKQELKPGDLVFFNTMRRAFSHVGIYIGENKFVHAPSTGNVVRVESMDSSYWVKRFNGARRIMPEVQAAEMPVQAETAVKP